VEQLEIGNWQFVVRSITHCYGPRKRIAHGATIPGLATTLGGSSWKFVMGNLQFVVGHSAKLPTTQKPAKKSAERLASDSYLE
jgi:hypothetical protein